MMGKTSSGLSEMEEAQAPALFTAQVGGSAVRAFLRAFFEMITAQN